MSQENPISFEEVTLGTGDTRPGVKLDSGIVVAFREGFTPEEMGEFEEKVIEALNSGEYDDLVLNALLDKTQVLVPIGRTWKAPGSVSENKDGEIVFYLHSF